MGKKKRVFETDEEYQAYRQKLKEDNIARLKLFHASREKKPKKTKLFSIPDNDLTDNQKILKERIKAMLAKKAGKHVRVVLQNISYKQMLENENIKDSLKSYLDAKNIYQNNVRHYRKKIRKGNTIDENMKNDLREISSRVERKRRELKRALMINGLKYKFKVNKSNTCRSYLIRKMHELKACSKLPFSSSDIIKYGNATELIGELDRLKQSHGIGKNNKNKYLRGRRCAKILDKYTKQGPCKNGSIHDDIVVLPLKKKGGGEVAQSVPI